MGEDTLITDNESFVNAVNEYLEKEFKGCAIFVDVPYYDYIEYGTDPTIKSRMSLSEKTVDIKGTVAGSTHRAKPITKARLEFRNWAEKKFGVVGKDRANIGDSVYRSVMENGLAPRPFIRASIYSAQNQLENHSDELTAGTSAKTTQDERIEIFKKNMTNLLKAEIERNMEEMGLDSSGNLSRAVLVCPIGSDDMGYDSDAKSAEEMRREVESAKNNSKMRSIK